MNYRVTTRDRIAHRIAVWAMTRLATPEYRAFVTVVNRMGKQALDEEINRVDSE
mgnify:CR=1 FL=1